MQNIFELRLIQGFSHPFQTDQAATFILIIEQVLWPSNNTTIHHSKAREHKRFRPERRQNLFIVLKKLIVKLSVLYPLIRILNVLVYL